MAEGYGYEVIVVGGGPAGVSAAVTAARKGLTCLLIAESIGGQAGTIAAIHNWLGDTSISGQEFTKRLTAHIQSFPDKVTVAQPLTMTAVDTSTEGFTVTASSGEKFFGETLILASGARRRALEAEGEAALVGRGVSYCVTCDAPYFKNKTVALVSDQHLYGVSDLLRYAAKVYLLQLGERNKYTKKTENTEDTIAAPRAMKNPLENSMQNHPAVETVHAARIERIEGQDRVTGITYRDHSNNSTEKPRQLAVDGVFIDIGLEPNSEAVKGLGACGDDGFVKVAAPTGATSHPGLFAAGDVTDNPYRHIQVAAGDGMKAALAAYDYLEAQKRYQ